MLPLLYLILKIILDIHGRVNSLFLIRIQIRQSKVIKLIIEKRQKSKQVGNKNAGYISINQWHFENVTSDVTYYVVLPKNTTLNMENPFTNLPRITDSANYQRREDLAI